MIKVLYQTSEKLNLSFFTNHALYEGNKFNIQIANTFNRANNLLFSEQFDVLISSYYLKPPDSGESFWLLFDLWRSQYNKLPLILFTTATEKIPKSVKDQNNFYVIDKTSDYQSLVPTVLEVTSNKGGSGRLCTPI